MNNAAMPLEEAQQHPAADRSAPADGAHSAARDAIDQTDWRQYFREHPCLFSAAATTLGFSLTPRRRVRARKVHSSAEAAQPADSKPTAGTSDTTQRSRNGLLRASVASLAAALVEEAIVLGMRRGREVLRQPVAHDRAEEPGAESKRPIAPGTAPEALSREQTAPRRQRSGAAEIQQAACHLQRYLKGAAADHPEMSLIAAVAAGVALGWAVKRR